HLVAIIKARPQDFHRVMTEGFRNVVGAAKEERIEGRVVLMSALGTRETTADTVPYFRAKHAMEQEAKASGLEYAIFRPSFVFGKRRRLVHVPWAVARTGARLTERLPGAPLTTDQISMLQAGDNVVSSTDAVDTFQLPLVPLDEQIRRAA